MLLRISGALVLLFGITVTTFAVFGLLDSASMAESFYSAAAAQNVVFDSATWSAHWRIWSVSLIVVGAVTSAAGLAMTLNLSWGLLLLATATAFAALFPWAQAISRTAKYAFEAPSVHESLVLAMLAISALVTCALSRATAVEANAATQTQTTS
jgi:hypothetical protein